MNDDGATSAEIPSRVTQFRDWYLSLPKSLRFALYLIWTPIQVVLFIVLAIPAFLILAPIVGTYEKLKDAWDRFE